MQTVAAQADKAVGGKPGFAAKQQPVIRLKLKVDITTTASHAETDPSPRC